MNGCFWCSLLLQRVMLAGAPDFEGEAGPEPAAGWADMISECWEIEPEKRCVRVLYAMHN